MNTQSTTVSFATFCLSATLLCTGCVGILPLPHLSNTPTRGTKLTSKQTAFIQPGTTSAAELFQSLGTNCVCSVYRRTVAYTWELPGGRGIAWVAGPGAGSGGVGEFEWGRWRAFLVAFDTNNVVTAADFVRLSARKSLHEHMKVWATKHHAAANRNDLTPSLALLP